MSTSPTVPIFDPLGTLRDIPYEQMHEAVGAGGTIGHRVQAPDGKIRIVAANRLQEAAKASGSVLPLETPQPEQPSALSTLWSDVKNFARYPSGVSPYPGMDLDAKQAIAQGSAERTEQRRQAGYGGGYRAMAPIGESIGVNVPGMEESARQGDEGGVLGHAAAVPTAMAAAELAPALAA
jgi:hypothetical protein